MIEGTLIAESLRVGAGLENLKLTVRKISRFQAQGTTPDQPDIWTTLDFEAEETRAAELAQVFADALDQQGWYVNFESRAESFVVFPGRIFRYPRGDQAGRAAAQAHDSSSPSQSRSWTGPCEAQAPLPQCRRPPGCPPAGRAAWRRGIPMRAHAPSGQGGQAARW